MADTGSVDALCGYFDVQFAGSPEHPADTPVTLSTAPDPTGATHWGQQVFFLYPPLQVKPGDEMEVTIGISRKKENHRLMEVWWCTWRCTCAQRVRTGGDAAHTQGDG